MTKKYPNCNLKQLVNIKATELGRRNAQYIKTSMGEAVNHFFVGSADKNLNSEQIAYKLIFPSMATKEHLVPRAKKGKDSFSNYLCDCYNCNADRHELSFDKWMQDFPNLKHNLDKHFATLANEIEAGRLPVEYCEYIRDVQNTIYQI